jgi:peroxiredoxin
MSTSYQQRLLDLQERYNELEGQLPDTKEKEAISVLHAMIQENIRARRTVSSENGAGETSGITLENIANLYKEASAMEGKAEKSGLPVGTKAPDFALPDANGNIVRLSDFEGKNVLLVFYPLDWSPACSDQLSLYQSEMDEFQRANVQILGISVDSIYSHGAWTAVRKLTFPLLADFHPKGEVAQKYQVMRDSDGFSERALFIIDTQGNIRYSHVAPQLDHVPDIYELLDQLKQLGPSEAVSANQ